MRIRVYRRDDALAHAVSASNVTHDARPRIFVECARGPFRGYGEVSPLVERLGDDPSVDEVLAYLGESALPRWLVADRARGSDGLPWHQVHLLASHEAVSRWSFAAIEMAVLDLELVERSRSLSDLWEVGGSTVPTIATYSLLDPGDLARSPGNAERIRLKTTAGLDVARLATLVGALARPAILDFNGGAGTTDEVLRQVSVLKGVIDLVAVEQPFALGDLASHVEAARSLPVVVGLDESVRSVTDVRLIARHGAAQIVCVKPPRVGGLAAATQIVRTARELGLRTYMGGFFESSLARTAHRVLAARLAPLEPSDVAPTALVGDDDRTRHVGIGVVPELSPAVQTESLGEAEI